MVPPAKSRRPKSSRIAKSERIDEVREVFERNYRFYQYHAVEFVTDHLADLSKQFEGDLQQALILAVIGQVELHVRITRPEAAFAPQAVGSITASRLADVTGIPRQTIRRKLAALARRDWIEQTETGAWRMICVEGVSRAKIDLGALDARGIARVADLFANLEEIVRAGQPVDDAE